MNSFSFDTPSTTDLPTVKNARGFLQKMAVPSIGLSLPKIKFPTLKLRKIRPLIIGLIAFVIIALALIIFSMSRISSNSAANPKVNVNQSFSILARDSKGNPMNKNASLMITNAEKANSVLIQGKKATVRDGKFFLLLNFEIDNPDAEVFYSNPTDLIRYVRSDGKKFAPTVYQGVLTIRPDSTKNSNIGFVVEKNDKNFKFEVGELEGEKKTIEVNF